MRVVHLIPRDGLGGVESAARSFAANERANVQVWFMSGNSLLQSNSIREVSPQSPLNSIETYTRTIVQLWAVRPEAIVVSLWRARLVGLIYKCLRPKIKLVSMIHSTRFSHFVDKWITHACTSLADEVWFDSEAAMRSFGGARAKRKRVISFLIRIPGSIVTTIKRRTFDFVYWGRLAEIKAVPRAISIFDRVKREFPVGRFYIYGPDDGALESIVEAISASSEPSAIKLMGIKPAGAFPCPIPECTFFLMTSNAEGMAISVVEAMQLGLVPIVTPVGEIPNYCVPGGNSLLVQDDERAVVDIISLLQNPTKLLEMQESAYEYWLNREDYSNDFESACIDLLTTTT